MTHHKRTYYIIHPRKRAAIVSLILMAAAFALHCVDAVLALRVSPLPFFDALTRYTLPSLAIVAYGVIVVAYGRARLEALIWPLDALCVIFVSRAPFVNEPLVALLLGVEFFFTAYVFYRVSTGRAKKRALYPLIALPLAYYLIRTFWLHPNGVDFVNWSAQCPYFCVILVLAALFCGARAMEPVKRKPL